jgi:hypothetical protein
MVSEIGKRMDLPIAHDPELDEFKEDVHPEDVLETIESREEGDRGDTTASQLAVAERL